MYSHKIYKEKTRQPLKGRSRPKPDLPELDDYAEKLDRAHGPETKPAVSHTGDDIMSRGTKVPGREVETNST